MNKTIVLVLAVVFGALAWRAIGMMDKAALALMLGILIGIVFSLPTALVILAERRQI